VAIVSSTSTVNVARQTLFADLDLRLLVHPLRQDIIPLYDTEAVKNSVKNLVLTNFYERPFQPFLGSNIRALLFDPINGFTARTIRAEIAHVIERNEPRVDSVNVIVSEDADGNAYNVSVYFNIAGVPDAGATVDFQLRRLR
jgi:phage baseplate assembly protein W